MSTPEHLADGSEGSADVGEAIMAGTATLVHYLYPVAITLPGHLRAETTVNRRYTDFESLRQQLSVTHWGCIVPPLPEKEGLGGAVTKVLSTTDAAFLESRRHGLENFLRRVLHHPLLRADPLLTSFTSEVEWPQALRNPVRPSPLLSGATFTEGLAKLLQRSGSSSSGGSAAAALPNEAYTELLRTEVEEGGAAAPVSLHILAATVAYADELNASTKALRERMRQLTTSRRRTGTALVSFGDAFGKLGAHESEGALRDAMAAIGTHSHKVADVYVEQARREDHLLNAVSYYVVFCEALKEAVQRLQAAHGNINHMSKQAAELRVAELKAAPEARAEVQNKVVMVEENITIAKAEVARQELIFRGEFRRFHEMKESDWGNILKTFSEIQMASSEAAREEWEQLRPVVERLATA